ncbi:hypothetical protein ABZP36_008370 [Zizania latifolia]
MTTTARTERLNYNNATTPTQIHNYVAILYKMHGRSGSRPQGLLVAETWTQSRSIIELFYFMS